MHVSQILVLVEGRALPGGLMIIGVFALVALRATFVNITVSTCSVIGLQNGICVNQLCTVRLSCFLINITEYSIIGRRG